MNIAIVGCGYVADMYMQTLPLHPTLRLVGVFDRDPERLAAFAAFHEVRPFETLQLLLDDSAVELVVNLTNPASHYVVSRQALEARRHVYSEKPLATTLADAAALVKLAEESGCALAAAPCNHLSEAVANLRRTLQSGRIGRPLLAYAEMDDGMIPGLDYPVWRSISGAAWPARDEFEVGCTMEHAGYQIAPLVELFGPVRRVTAMSACLMPEKGSDVGVTILSPDFSVGILEFDNDVRARLTCSILAPGDRSLRLVGTSGVATLSDVWEYDSPVRHSGTGMGVRPRVLRKIEKRLSRLFPGLMLGSRVKDPSNRQVTRTQGGHRMDFARGIAQLAAQVEQGLPTRVSAALALHITEVTLALQDAGRHSSRTMSNTF